MDHSLDDHSNVGSEFHAPPADKETLRLKAFINCTADAILAFDRTGAMTDWNAGAERIFGYTAAEAIGQSYTLIGTSEVHAFQHSVFTETLRGNTHQWYDTQRRRKDGTVIDVSITTSPLMIEGQIIGLVAIVRDITEKVRAAEELRRRNTLLDATARQLSELNIKLQTVAEEKRHFVNMVIHDLRHPLTSIRTVLYLLRNTDDSSQGDDYLNVIEGRVSALTALLNELTEYHRIEAGRARLRIEPVDIAALLQKSVDNFSPALVGDHVRIVTHVDPCLGCIATDAGKLTHILLNLLSNALKFTPQGTISVAGRCEDAEHWSLTVEDTGLGMGPEIQSRVFEEFYQGERPLQRQDGSGLGLSIAKQLCEALDGKMELNSVFGRGTRFRLLFPYHLVPISASEPTIK